MMTVNIVLNSTISIAVAINGMTHKQQRIQLNRQIIEWLVLIFHTIFAIIDFDSVFVMPTRSNPVEMGTTRSSIIIMLCQQLIAGLTCVFDTFNSQSVWTITINLIPAVDALICTAKSQPIQR